MWNKEKMQKVVMRISLFSIVVFSSIKASHEREFKKQLKVFSGEVEETEKILEATKREGTPVCVSPRLIQIRMEDRATKVGLHLMRNTEHLSALSTFTNDKLIITPRIHRKLLQDKHDARHLLKKYENIHETLRTYTKYTLKKQRCVQNKR